MTVQEAAMVRFSANSAPTGLRDRIHITGGRIKVMGLRGQRAEWHGLRTLGRHVTNAAAETSTAQQQQAIAGS
jgi:hypothetical protein